MGRRLGWFWGVVGVLWILSVPMASAHPLGNFTLNHYAGLELHPQQIDIDYVLDMAEIPAFQEIHRLDPRGNRPPEATARTEYAASHCADLLTDLILKVQDQPAVLTVEGSRVDFPPGVGGLLTLRLSCRLQSSVVPQGQVTFYDQTDLKRLGWREITVRGVGIPIRTTAATESISHRLQDYPTALLSSPLVQHSITVDILPTTVADELTSRPTSSWEQKSVSSLWGRSNDAFTQLLTVEHRDPWTIAVALGIAFVWGGFHALSPGHGKTIVGAYLVGSRGTARHALLLGLVTTLTHTAGIFALGLLALATSEVWLTEAIFPWLSALSGILVMAIGIQQVRQRLRTGQDHIHVHDHDHPHSHDHDHSHPHAHDHEHRHHDHEHQHVHSQGSHSHHPPVPMSWRQWLAVGISGGILPCPSALVVLLGSIALGQIGFGLALVTAFSLGLASVLTGVGLILVHAHQWFEQLPLTLPQWRLLPVASALLMALLGLGMTTQAIVQGVH